MLDLESVHAHYGSSHVLQGVDLSIGEGEAVGLFGRNGVGKTTILRAIAGWLRPSSGVIRFAGKSIGGLSPDAICRMGIGFVPEDRRIFPGLSVEENLRLGFWQTPGRSGKQKRALLGRVFELFPRLKERRGQSGTTLSGGEQQMLAIARVLLGDQKLILIDEPTEGLAPIIVDEIFAIMAQLKAEKRAILLVEQNVRRGAAFCGKVCAVERGRIIFEGNSENERDRSNLLKTIAVTTSP
jgi:branched-chain amino acid transport system ATP-binding protein